MLTINEIISMNDYGIYIWPAYLMTAFVFLLNFISVLYEKRKIQNIIKNDDHLLP